MAPSVAPSSTSLPPALRPVDCPRRAAVLVDHRRHRVHLLADRTGRAVERPARDHRARGDGVRRPPDRGRHRPRDPGGPHAPGGRPAGLGRGPEPPARGRPAVHRRRGDPGRRRGWPPRLLPAPPRLLPGPSGRDLRHQPGRLRALAGGRRRHPQRRDRGRAPRGAGRAVDARVDRAAAARARGREGGDGPRRRRAGTAVGRRPGDRLPRPGPVGVARARRPVARGAGVRGGVHGHRPAGGRDPAHARAVRAPRRAARSSPASRCGPSDGPSSPRPGAIRRSSAS